MSMSNFVAIHNAQGQVALWLYGDRLMTLRGQSVGFLYGEHVYDYNGFHRGRFVDGVLRDHQGAVVGFTPEASGPTPLLPLRRLRPLTPLRSLEPLRPLRSRPPLAPLNRLAWSERGPLALFEL